MKNCFPIVLFFSSESGIEEMKKALKGERVSFHTDPSKYGKPPVAAHRLKGLLPLCIEFENEHIKNEFVKIVRKAHPNLCPC